MENENVIELKNISIEYKMKTYNLRAVDNLSINFKRGKVTALVGESGSGKSTLVSSILQCLSSPGEVVGGKIIFNSTKNDQVIDVLGLAKNDLQNYRWNDVSMVFQASQNSLNPLMKIGEQFYETAHYHGEKRKYEEYVPRIIELLEYVKLDAKRVIHAYPHELSGGMKQRVMIAFSLLLDPEVIILDEPTTALDVITQKYIFDILSDINKQFNKTMILLTHDIGVVAKFADYVGVMYAGKLVEYGDVYTVFEKHYHPYTEGLIFATPSFLSDVNSIKSIKGSVPNLMNLPQGCAFGPRCEKFCEKCLEVQTEYQVEEGHMILCSNYQRKVDNK